MATAEINPIGTEGEQEKKMLSSSEEDTHPPLAPLNFSELTPSQFGISVQSFTPEASSKHKDKSRLAQIKARRRSSVGVRGSPETNSLICFRAQQRMKTPPTHQTSEHVSRSPFVPRVASTLRQKMASFQSLMDVEESEVCDPMPRQDGNTGGRITTRDYLSDGNSTDGGKENHPPMMTPVPRKRRCLGPPAGCELEIREAGAPILHFSLKEQEQGEEPETQVLTQGPPPSGATVEEAQAVRISPPVHVYSEPLACSPTENQQGGVFKLQSPSRPPPDDPAAASAAHLSSPSHLPSLPSLLENKPAGEAVTKKKRVRFGGPLSPEFFDKDLPPSTPLQKGATPCRAPTPGGVLRLRSVLKTPQRSQSQTPQAQPDLCSPTDFGASPTLAIPRNGRTPSVGDECEDGDMKIVFPSMEELDSAMPSDTEVTLDPQPLNLNTAFHEESLSQTVTEPETKSSATAEMDVLGEPASLTEEEKQPAAGVEASAPVRSSKRRKMQPQPECESPREAPAHSSNRKRKQPEESEPVKRSTRTTAKLASGRMKKTCTTARRFNKDVDRSLYGSREYASKNPTLSPITERLSLIGRPPDAQQTPSTSCTGREAPNPETHLKPEMVEDTPVTGDLHVTHAFTCPDSSEESTPGGRRLSGQGVRGRGRKKRKIPVGDCRLLSEEPQDQAGGKAEEHLEEQTPTNISASKEAPFNHTAHEQAVQLSAKTSADTPSTDSDRKSGCHAGPNACPPSGERLNCTLSLPAELAQGRAEQGGKSRVNSSVLQQQGGQVVELQTDAQGDQAASQRENIRSISDSQEEEGAANLDLAPWQTDFNFEDVFKPVTTRGQRSVRRSLRNQSGAAHSDNGAGLAWLPRTSPDSTKEARRKTRGRRSSAHLSNLSAPEETQDNAS